MRETNSDSHLARARFTKSPLAWRARFALAAELGYQFRSEGQAAAEIGVRLMDAGRPKELGLAPEQAVKLAQEYTHYLEENMANQRNLFRSAYKAPTEEEIEAAQKNVDLFLKQGKKILEVESSPPPRFHVDPKTGKVSGWKPRVTPES